jgi:hypothetical protein
MSQPQIGKLLIRFIKDWGSIIKESNLSTKLHKKHVSSTFYHWYGIVPENDNKLNTIKSDPSKIKD